MCFPHESRLSCDCSTSKHKSKLVPNLFGNGSFHILQVASVLSPVQVLAPSAQSQTEMEKFLLPQAYPDLVDDKGGMEKGIIPTCHFIPVDRNQNLPLQRTLSQVPALYTPISLLPSWSWSGSGCNGSLSSMGDWF